MNFSNTPPTPFPCLSPLFNASEAGLREGLRLNQHTEKTQTLLAIQTCSQLSASHRHYSLPVFLPPLSESLSPPPPTPPTPTHTHLGFILYCYSLCFSQTLPVPLKASQMFLLLSFLIRAHAFILTSFFL